jgi:hypothetical protein
MEKLKNNTESIIGVQLLESYYFWHKKRLLFNILVGSSGVLLLIISDLDFFPLSFILFGSLIWGLVANAFYSTGYALESFVITRSKGNKTLREVRVALFCLGTIFYILFGVIFVGLMTFRWVD